MKHCALCKEFHDIHDINIQGPITTMKEYFPESRIIAEDDGLCLFPTVGCFVAGYTLLVPLHHYISLYNCPDDLVERIEQAFRTIRDAYKKLLKSDMIFFEHGTVDDQNLSSASVCHCHLHILPVHEELWDFVNDKCHFSYYKLASIKDVKKAVNEKKIASYFLFGDSDGSVYLIDCSKTSYPSQFLRKAVYEYYYGVDDGKWDWKNYPYYDFMHETLKILSGVKI